MEEILRGIFKHFVPQESFPFNGFILLHGTFLNNKEQAVLSPLASLRRVFD